MQNSWNQFVNRIFRAPALWGSLFSAVFYVCIHQPRFQGTTVHKYTTEHVTEYAIVILFCWGLAHLGLRLLGFGRERLALRHEWIPPRTEQEPPTHALDLYAHLDEAPSWLQSTILGKRLRLALAYVGDRGSAEGFREYLEDLADRDSVETHSNYSFPRFVAGVTPVLGLLGTVVHFGTALGGLSSEALMEQLPTMVTGMGTAFNTTCVALTASITTMLFLFLLERQEDLIVKEVNSIAEAELLNRFTSADIRISPFMDVVKTAHHATLAAIQQREQKQVEVWTRVMEAHAGDVKAAIDRLEKVNHATAQLAKLVTADERLLELQQRLADNLELLRETRQFDEAVHGLTAAIHLLTARHSHLSKAA